MAHIAFEIWLSQREEHWRQGIFITVRFFQESLNKAQKSYGHPLHPDLTPDVLTCVLPLGTVSSGRESEVESVHLFLTIIQFFSACHLTSQHTSTCIHNSIISHSPRLSQDQGCFYYLGHVMQKLLNCSQVQIEYFLITL